MVVLTNDKKEGQSRKGGGNGDEKLGTSKKGFGD